MSKSILSYWVLIVCTISCGGPKDSSSSLSQNSSRLSASPELDLSFATDGRFTHDSAAGGSFNDSAMDLTIASNGDIFLTGQSDSSGSLYDMTIWKLNSNGALDTTFGSPNGFTTHNNAAGGGSSDYGSAIALDSNSRVIVAGASFAGMANIFDMAIWRYSPSGTLDTTFGGGDGVVVHAGAAGANKGDFAYSIIIDSSDNIIVAGLSENIAGNDDLTIWKFNSSGDLDLSFGGGDGLVTHHNAASGNGDDHAYAMAFDSSGNIIVAGTSNNGSDNDITIWKFSASGILDTSFGGGDGYLSIDLSTSDSVSTLKLTPDDHILVCATASDKMTVIKILQTGVIDSSFGESNGYTQHLGAGTTSTCKDLETDFNNKILVVGSSFDGSNRSLTIWRFNSGGLLDKSFNDDESFKGFPIDSTAEISKAAIDPSGRIIVVGQDYVTTNKDTAVWAFK